MFSNRLDQRPRCCRWSIDVSVQLSITCEQDTEIFNLLCSRQWLIPNPEVARRLFPVKNRSFELKKKEPSLIPALLTRSCGPLQCTLKVTAWWICFWSNQKCISKMKRTRSQNVNEQHRTGVVIGLTWWAESKLFPNIVLGDGLVQRKTSHLWVFLYILLTFPVNLFYRRQPWLTEVKYDNEIKHEADFTGGVITWCFNPIIKPTCGCPEEEEASLFFDGYVGSCCHRCFIRTDRHDQDTARWWVLVSPPTVIITCIPVRLTLVLTCHLSRLWKTKKKTLLKTLLFPLNKNNHSNAALTEMRHSVRAAERHRSLWETI